MNEQFNLSTKLNCEDGSCYYLTYRLISTTKHCELFGNRTYYGINCISSQIDNNDNEKQIISRDSNSVECISIDKNQVKYLINYLNSNTVFPIHIKEVISEFKSLFSMPVA